MQPTASSLLAEPEASLRMLAEQEFEIRREASEPAEPSAMLATLARVLELNLAVAALQEAMHEIGLRTVAEALAQIDRIFALAVGIARLDLTRVLEENAGRFPPHAAGAWTHADQPAATDIAKVVRSVNSLLTFCPPEMLESLEELAQANALADLSHRCRVAHEGLQSFVHRNSSRQDPGARVVGRAYAEGRLSLAEVAAVLRLPSSDAVAFLETNGFCRSLETVALPGEERQRLLASIREDRLKRAGRPEATALVSRSVIASQRIEGVDARPWVPRG
jgi:hypothetical protein